MATSKRYTEQNIICFSSLTENMKQKEEAINAKVNKIQEVGLGHTIACLSILTFFIFINGIY
jgi:hypothetical protein